MDLPEKCEMPAINAGRDEVGRLLKTSRTIAVVGLSPNPNRLSHRVALYLKSAGYKVVQVQRLRVGRTIQCGKVKRQAQARLELVQGKIAGLHAMERVLQRLIRTCSAKATTNRCPILESLEDGRKSP